MMIALRRFTGVIAGKVSEFRPGDTISADDAEAMGLASKPHLAKKEAKSDKPAET